MNLYPLLRELAVRNKDGLVVPLEPNWAQREVLQVVHDRYHAGLPVRIIVLKARQLGISTISEAILYGWCLRFPNTNAAIVAHQTTSAEHLYGMTRFFHDGSPWCDALPTKYSTRSELVFADLGSSIKVMTANTVDKMRSLTASVAHLSELGFWKQPEATMLALNQAIPNRHGSVVIIESTANGLGNLFEDYWTQAVAGESDYVPLFFPWHKHPEYVCCNDSCSRCAGLTIQNAMERELTKLGATRQHLAWRRWCIANNCLGSEELFLQEYPHTPESAFLTSGVNAFPEDNLKACFVPQAPEVGRLEPGKDGIEFIPDPTGPIRIYRKPGQMYNEYFVGADPAHGVIGGDRAAAHVINRVTQEQVAVWHGTMNPTAFGEELIKLARYYKDAWISTETDGPGYATAGYLAAKWPRLWQQHMADRLPGQDMSNQLGWSTNWKRKQWAIAKLAECFERGTITIHDKATFRELRAYVYYGAERADVFGKASKEGHDDLVMSLAITIICHSLMAPPAPVAVAKPDPRGLIYAEAEGWNG